MSAARISSPQSSIRFGPFELLPLMGELRKDGVKLKISGQPLEILLVLLVRAGDVVARDELRDSLWRSDIFVDFEHSLNAAVKRLRIALDDDVASPQYIETVPRRGYRFIGEIHDELSTEPLTDERESPNDSLVRAPQIVAGKSDRSSRSAIMLLAVLCFVAGLLWAKVLAALLH
jgi:DNA-binding winged helix-turn-helix (wHTH) protein